MTFVFQTSGPAHPFRKGIVVKFVILLFPASATELSDTPDSRFAGWPGIKLYEGTFPVIPKPTVPWQCPIVPFLRPGVPFSEHAMAPSGKQLRAAVSAVMRKAGQPHVLDNGSSVVKKWREIRANPRLLTLLSPDTTWPYVKMSPTHRNQKVRPYAIYSIVFFSKTQLFMRLFSLTVDTTQFTLLRVFFFLPK